MRSVKSRPSTFTHDDPGLLELEWGRTRHAAPRGWEFGKCSQRSGLPKGWRLRELLIETLLAEQPVGRHLAFALDVGGPAVFDVVSADLHQSIPRRLAQMDTPRRPGRLHPRGGVHRVAE